MKTTFTLQDYPGELAQIIWFSGCNLRCPYCHNPSFVHRKKEGVKDILQFLTTRKELLTGVVLSGGECTTYPHIVEFARAVKLLGLKIKIDTNGQLPGILEELIDNELIDYYALDCKAPPGKEFTIPGFDIDNWRRSFVVLQDSGLPGEVRTTVHTKLLQEDDINNIIKELCRCGYAGNYFIQNFVNTNTLSEIQSQVRTLDIGEINTDTPFQIGFRNF